MARFFLQRGLEFKRADMVAMAVQAAREAIVLFADNASPSPGVADRRAMLLTVPPVILAVYRDALAASEHPVEAKLVEAVLAQLGATPDSPYRH